MKPAPFRFDEPGSRILREFSARRAAERQIAQRRRADMRSQWYDGVTGGGGMASAGFAGAAISRLTNSFAQWSGAINSDLDGALSVLRARARQLSNNNEFGRRFLSLVATNIVGHAGPTLQVRALTAGGELDKVANDAIEVAWANWCKRADVRGLMDFAHVQRVGIKSVARDGETLIRIVRRRDLASGIGVQLLESDRLDDSINRVMTNGNIIRQGVELDALQRPVAYYIKAAHPGENYQSQPAKVERVPAGQVLHPYLIERAEQVRGYTWFHAVLMRMQMLGAYEEAAVVAARVGASKMGAFTRKDDGGSARPVAEGLADGMGAGGLPQMSAEAGEFMDLTGMPGVTLETWNPEYPHANFDSFLKACFRGVASGLDIAAHNLTGDMTGVNYSSARIAELSEREQWRVLQKWWLHTVTLPIFRLWLESALIMGEIRFPDSGKALPYERLNKFTEAARFQPRTWHWVDPAKEIDAAEREVSLGIRSRTEIAAAQGREIEDVIDEQAQEQKLMKAAGLMPAPAAPAPVAANETEVDEDDPSEEEETAADRTAQRQTTRALLAAAVKLLQREDKPPVFNLDARTTVNVPPAEINLEANIPAPAAPVVEIRNEMPQTVVNVNPTPVEIVNNVEAKSGEVTVSVELPPRKTVSDVEYSAGGDIKRVTQLETDA